MSAENAPTITFGSADAANLLVAGIPAAARALATAATDERFRNRPLLIAVAGGWVPSPLTKHEAARLAPDVDWKAVDLVDPSSLGHIAGESLQSTAGSRVEAAGISALHEQARLIVANTGKQADGIVSRTINRPISRAITRVVLRHPVARPWHATLAAGLLGVAMFLALVFGGSAGLIAGAVLFQLASIVDGVDGEMARATFRSSARGAMMDSLTDAATNLGFIGGVSYNLFTAGHREAALAGAAGCALLAMGNVILAWQSRRDGGAFTFDALKTRFRERPSRIKQWLTYITMRDFYALAACLAILSGLAQTLLFTFAGVAAGWLCVLCWTLFFGRQAHTVA
ncbi:MAG: CDP-alcohol phosphatidyltransferase family protein [Erythrobacter sp.]